LPEIGPADHLALFLRFSAMSSAKPAPEEADTAPPRSVVRGFMPTTIRREPSLDQRLQGEIWRIGKSTNQAETGPESNPISKSRSASSQRAGG
jgi:hypothetical protein